HMRGIYQKARHLIWRAFFCGTPSMGTLRRAQVAHCARRLPQYTGCFVSCDTESTMKSGSFTFIRFTFILAVSLALLGMTAAMPATANEESHRAPKFPYASLQAEAVTEVARDMVRLTLA